MQIVAKSDSRTTLYDQVITRFDPDSGTLWYYMNPKPRPCMMQEMVREIRELQRHIKDQGGTVEHEGQSRPVRFMVYASAYPDVFNLGGDLAYVLSSVRNRERDSLFDYARLCVDVLHANLNALDLPITTISMIRGDALGGGLEAALSSSFIVAERGAQLGFPEILFNLFPGVGAYSLLAKRMNIKRAQDLLLSGRLYDADQLHEMGVIDAVADPGEAVATVRDYIRRVASKQNSYLAIDKARRVCSPITYDELIEIAGVWADAAMNLTDKDTRKMERLLKAQERARRDTFPQIPAREAV